MSPAQCSTAAAVEQAWAWAQAEAVPGSLRQPPASPDLRRGLVVAVLQAWHPLPEVARLGRISADALGSWPTWQ